MRSSSGLVARQLIVGVLVMVLVGATRLDAQVPPDHAIVRVEVMSPPGLTSGAPVVRLTSDAEPGLRREATLQDGGPGGGVRAWFDALGPATYTVLVELPGAEPARLQVHVEPREIISLRATLAPAGQNASRLEVVDRSRIGAGTDFDRRLIEDLPTARDVWALAETAAPFVVVDRMDTGGLGTGQSALVGSRGESWMLSELVFGEIRVRHGNRGPLLPIAPTADAADAVAVTAGLAPVEVGTPGVRVSLTPRMPGPRWRGILQASATTPGMVATNARPEAPSIARVEAFRDVGGSAGGPLGDHVGFVLSGGAAHMRQQERDRTERLTSRSASVFAQVVAHPGTADRVRLEGGWQEVAHPFDGRRQFGDGRVDERGSFGQLQLSWDHVGRGGSRRALSAGLQRSLFTPQVSALSGVSIGATVDRVLDGVVPGPASSVDSADWNARAEVSGPLMHWRSAAHAWRAGLSVERMTSSAAVLAAPWVAEAAAGLPARVWQPSVPAMPSRRSATELAIYASDRIALSPGLSVDAGLRWDLSSGSADGAAEGITWNALSPRVSFRWSHGAIALIGGYGRYGVGNILPLLAFGDPGAPWSEVRRWEDSDGNGLFDAGESGVLVARAGRGAPVGSIDPDLRTPRSDEWTIGAEYRHAPGATLRGAIVIRRQWDLPGSINTGVPLSAYRVFTIPDINSDEGSAHDDQMLAIYERLPVGFGQDAFELTNPDRARATYEGIELSWDLRSDRWAMIFGATAYRSVGLGGNLGFGALENDAMVVGERFEDPNAADDEEGRLFFDRAYVGKWSASYRAPHDVRLAFTARYQDGQPFTRVVVAPDLAAGPQMVHAYAMGRTRFTYTATVDVRVEKGFGVGGRRAAVRLDAFNITNHRNEVEEDVLTGPTFRQSTAVQPPLTLRLGFRLDF